MKKKVISLLLCGAMSVGALAGCGSPTPAAIPSASGDTSASAGDVTASASAGDTSASEANPGTDKGTIYMFVSGPENADAINTLIDEYKKVQPGVTINYETTQNDYPTLLKAKINSGTVPDLFSSAAGKEMNDYESYSYDLSKEPIAAAMNDQVKATLKTTDGQLGGFAIKGNFFGIVYDKDAFTKAGITDFPKTYADLEKDCQTLQAAGITPFSSGFAEWWVFKHSFQSFLDAAGGDDVQGLVTKFENGQAHMKDYPALYTDFFNYIDLVKKYGDQKPLETDLAAEEAALGTGKAAMITGQGAWVEADLLKINPQINIGFNGYPINDDASLCKVISGADQAIHVSKDSKVRAQTLDFINWWYTSDYGKQWFSDVANLIPPITAGKMPDMAIVKQGNDLVASEGSLPLSITYSSDGFFQAMGQIMQSYVAGTVDKDTACTQIEQKWAQLDGPTS